MGSGLVTSSHAPLAQKMDKPFPRVNGIFPEHCYRCDEKIKPPEEGGLHPLKFLMEETDEGFALCVPCALLVVEALKRMDRSSEN